MLVRGFVSESIKRVLEAMLATGLTNPIVLSGDIHSNWVARFLRDFDDENSEVVATEFTGPSASSGGNGEPEAAIGATPLPHNPHFDFYNSQQGYVLTSVTPDVWTSTYHIVSEVETPGGEVEPAATFVVENGHPGVSPA